MSVTTRSLAGALVAVLGAEGLHDDAATVADAAVDGVAPRWVAAPATAEQLAQVLLLAHAEDLVVIPRGSGGNLEHGCPPRRVDLVLDLRRLDAVIEHNPDDLTVSVQAGMTAGTLAARLAPLRQALPLDPPGWSGRTLGGIAATQASGPLRMRYGSMRDLLLGVRFVQADGVLTWGGAKVVKSVTGYDVPKLMVGSLGTLGVLCELTLRLHPRPESEATRLAVFETMEAAGDFVARLLDSTLEPNRIELLNRAALARLDGVPRATAAVAVSVGSVDAAVRAQMATIEGLARETGRTATPAASDFWAAYGAMLDEAGRTLTLHVASLPARIVEAVRSIESALASTAPGEEAVVAGCAALGTLDVMLPASVSAAPMAARLVERMREDLAPLGGHAIVRRAPVELRRQIDPWGPVDPGVMALMQALRDEFDPRRVLNPGRFVGRL